MDDRAERDPDEQVGPDAAEDRRTSSRPSSIRSDQVGLSSAVPAGPACGGGLEDERLDAALEAHPAEHRAGDDRDQQAGADVERGDREAEQAVEQDDRDLVHHRARDQERQGHAERDTGGDEADEGGDGAAGAERRHDAEPGGGDVAEPFALAAEQRAGAFDREEAAQDADGEDDPDQQQQDLGRVVEEEVQRVRPARVLRKREDVVEQPVPERQQRLVERQPAERGSAEQPERMPLLGDPRPGGDRAHARDLLSRTHDAGRRASSTASSRIPPTSVCSSSRRSRLAQ